MLLGKLFHVNDLRNFFIIISSGVFTSSFVTLLISVSEYNVEKQEALEDFFDANIEFIANLYNLEYLRIDIPLELLREYYAETSGISVIKRSQGNVYTYESQNRIKEYLWQQEPESIKKLYNTQSSQMVYLKEKFDKKIAEYDKQIDFVMKQYIEIAEKMNIRNLNKTIGRIDFLLKNKKYRKEFLYNKVYARQSELLRKIKNAAYHFGEYYKASNGNKLAMINFIMEIQNFLFSSTQKNGFDNIYMQYIFEMNCEMHKLLKLIYGKRNADSEPKIEDYFRCSYWLDDLEQNKNNSR